MLVVGGFRRAKPEQQGLQGSPNDARMRYKRSAAARCPQGIGSPPPSRSAACRPDASLGARDARVLQRGFAGGIVGGKQRAGHRYSMIGTVVIRERRDDA